MHSLYKRPFLKIISFLGKKKEKKHFSETPIYIGGCGRSGTTLLLSILSSHPAVFACPNELGMYNDVLADKNGGYKPKRLDRLYRTFLANKIEKSNVRWCEKSPSNVVRINEIDSFHNGDFKLIHIVRDGRDVILSKHPKDPSNYWVTPERWVNDVSAGLKEYDNPKVHTVKYEDLISDFENSISKICKFLDLETVEEILNWHKNAQVKKNKAYYGKVQPIFKSSVAKWKLPENKERVAELMKNEEAIKLLSFFEYEV